jgi:hypothetical protein
MISALPPQEHSFTINVKGSSTGEQFQGSFTYARPTLGTNIEIAKTEAFMKGGAALDEDASIITNILATLRHTLIKYPDWWKEAGFGANMYDVNVVLAIMGECNKFEKERLEKINKATESKDEQANRSKKTVS